VFDEVTKQERGKRAARKTAYIAASAALQALCVAAIGFAGDQLRAAATGTPPLVAVKFIHASPSLPAPPPAGQKHQPPAKPRAEPPARSPPPTALIQPKEIPAQLAHSSADQPEVESGDSADEGASGAEGGVIGGVVGAQAQGGGGIEDGPVYATPGARRPAAAVRDCVQNTIRIPRDLQGFLSGPVVVEFAIRQDGTPTHFRMLTAVSDNRIADAIWQAVSSCQWIPGADERGRPAWFRVMMPLRFKSG
jgi:protein TonB